MGSAGMISEGSKPASIRRIEPVLRGWINVDRTIVDMPDGGIVERHVEDHGAGVAVLPYDCERRTALLISQPRAAVIFGGDTDILEVIAGRLDNVAPIERVRQEAMEEAGIELEQLDFVVHLWTMPSISTERLYLYLAPYTASMRSGRGGGRDDEHENVTVHEIPLAVLACEADAGRLLDAKTLILVQTLQLRRPELFKS